MKRGYLGVAGQPVHLSETQQGPDGREHALLVVDVTPDSPAAAAGLLVGDLMIAFDRQPVDSPEELLDLLLGDRVGQPVPVRVLRGTATVDLTVTVGERPRPERAEGR
jgi:S1-C subfamily serine protease